MRWYVLLAATLAISLEIVHAEMGEQSSGPAVCQVVSVRPEIVAQASVVANEVGNPSCVNNKVLPATADIYVTGIVNRSVTCKLLDTGATVSVLK